MKFAWYDYNQFIKRNNEDDLQYDVNHHHKDDEAEIERS